jgi:hypothetical protein
MPRQKALCLENNSEHGEEEDELAKLRGELKKNT